MRQPLLLNNIEEEKMSDKSPRGALTPSRMTPRAIMNQGKKGPINPMKTQKFDKFNSGMKL